MRFRARNAALLLALTLLALSAACTRARKEGAKDTPADGPARPPILASPWFGEIPGDPSLPPRIRGLRFGMSVQTATGALPRDLALDLARKGEVISISKAGDPHRLELTFALEPPLLAELRFTLPCDALKKIESAWGPLTRYAADTALEEAFWPLEDMRIQLAPHREEGGVCAIEVTPYLSVGTMLGPSSDQLAFEKVPLIGLSAEQLEDAYPHRIDATRSATAARIATELIHARGAELVDPPFLIKRARDRYQLALGMIEHAPARIAEIDLAKGRVSEVRITFDLARSSEARDRTGGQIEDKWEIHDETTARGQFVYHAKRQVVLEDDRAAGLFYLTIRPLGAALPPSRARRPPPERYARFDLRDRGVAWLGPLPAAPGMPELLNGITPGMAFDAVRKKLPLIVNANDLEKTASRPRPEPVLVGRARARARRTVSGTWPDRVVRVSSEEDPASMVMLGFDAERRILSAVSVYFPWPGSKQWLRTRWGDPEPLGPGRWQWRSLTDPPPRTRSQSPAKANVIFADLLELPSISILSFTSPERSPAIAPVFVLGDDAVAELPELAQLLDLRIRR